MKAIKSLLLLGLFLLPQLLWAQEWADGTIRRIDTSSQKMTATTVISKTRESLIKTNALSSDRSKAGVKKSLFIAASPSRPMNPKNFRAKSCP